MLVKVPCFSILWKRHLMENCFCFWALKIPQTRMNTDKNGVDTLDTAPAASVPFRQKTKCQRELRSDLVFISAVKKIFLRFRQRELNSHTSRKGRTIDADLNNFYFSKFSLITSATCENPFFRRALKISICVFIFQVCKASDNFFHAIKTNIVINFIKKYSPFVMHPIRPCSIKCFNRRQCSRLLNFRL